jgi:hypothetical protein
MTTQAISQPTIVLPDLLANASSRRGAPRIVGYRAAAFVYGLDGIPDLVPEFLVPHGTWKRSGFDHQRRRIDDVEFVEADGGLITTVRQTLGDLCAVVPLNVVERAAESALRLKLVEEFELREFAALFAFSRHGTPGLRDVLDRRPIGAPATGSDLETMYLQAIRLDPAIPVPERQWPVLDRDGNFVAFGDFGFPPRDFIVETDGHRTHMTVEQQNYDIDRQNRIWSSGTHMRRFTYRQVTCTPRNVCKETLLGLRTAPLVIRKTSPRSPIEVVKAYERLVHPFLERV